MRKKALKSQKYYKQIIVRKSWEKWHEQHKKLLCFLLLQKFFRFNFPQKIFSVDHSEKKSSLLNWKLEEKSLKLRRRQLAKTFQRPQLHRALLNRDVSYARHLLLHGADVNARNNDGVNTILMLFTRPLACSKLSQTLSEKRFSPVLKYHTLFSAFATLLRNFKKLYFKLTKQRRIKFYKRQIWFLVRCLCLFLKLRCLLSLF